MSVPLILITVMIRRDASIELVHFSVLVQHLEADSGQMELLVLVCLYGYARCCECVCVCVCVRERERVTRQDISVLMRGGNQ